MIQSNRAISATPEGAVAPSAEPARESRRKQTLRRTGFVLVLIGTIGCLMSSWRFRHLVLFGADFRALYGSSRCMAAGCDPYSGDATRQQFLAHGGTPFEVEAGLASPFTNNYLDYPPTSLFYLMPFALLPWRMAWYLSLAISLGVYAAASFKVSDLCSDYSPIGANLLLACFLIMVNFAVVLANPALLASGLCCLSVLLLLEDRRPRLSVALFTLSLLLKPHLGAFILLYFLVAGASYRRRALQIIAATIALSMPALIWVSVRPSSHNWLQELSANLAGVSSRGQLSDPGPTNLRLGGIVDLRTVFALIRDDRAFYTHMTYAVSICFLALWLYPVIKLGPSRQKDLIAIASIACFGLLPVYHRSADVKLLLLVYPAIALLMRRTRWFGFAAVCIGILIASVSERFWLLVGVFLPTVVQIMQKAVGSLFPQLVQDRPEPLLFLASALFFVVVLYTMMWSGWPVISDPATRARGELG